MIAEFFLSMSLEVPSANDDTDSLWSDVSVPSDIAISADDAKTQLDSAIAQMAERRYIIGEYFG